MKNIFLGLSVLIIILSSCKKEEEVNQIELTLKNLTSLLGKSSGYIKDASPGVFAGTYDEYLGFNIQNGFEVIETGVIIYYIEDDKCKTIDVFSDDMNNIDEVKNLMSLPEKEFGNASNYYLSYTDSLGTSKEKSFDTFNQLWAFISTNGIVAEDIAEISAIHTYKDYYFISGGLFNQEQKILMPVIEIGYIKDFFKKSAKIGQIDNNVIIYFRKSKLHENFR
jgi:hypothetical protein